MDKDGPHLKFEAQFSYSYDLSSGRIASVSPDITITPVSDLMKSFVGGFWDDTYFGYGGVELLGKVRYLVSNLAGTKSEEIVVPFETTGYGLGWEWNSVCATKGMTIYLGSSFYHNDVQFTFKMTEMACSGNIMIPVATYTTAVSRYRGFYRTTYTATQVLTRTLMNVYATTYTATFSPDELQEFFTSGGVAVLSLVIAGVIAVLFVVFLKRKGRFQGKMPATLGTKPCVRCGYLLPTDAEYCSECGEKQV
jgi:ribosomal protein L40E